MYRDAIRTIYPYLSPGYRRIADFLLAHYQDAAFMTASAVAQAAQVDTALVVRLAQRLGYPGFPELIAEIQEEVKRDLRKIYEREEGGNTPVQVFRRHLLQDRNNLEYMLLHLDEQKLSEILEMFQRANRIFVIGEANTNYLAEAFSMRLLALGFSACTVSTEVAGQAAIVTGLRRGDLVLAISVTAMNPGVIAFVKSARDVGVNTIGIVPSMTNPVAAVVEHSLHAPVRTQGLVPSWTAIASTLSALSQALALSAPEATAEWAIRTDHFLRRYEETLKHDLANLRSTLVEYNEPSDAQHPAPTLPVSA